MPFPTLDSNMVPEGLVGMDNTLRANIILNAFRIAVNGSLSVQEMVDGVVDEFEDEAGVDTTTSTDETYDSLGDYYHNPGTPAPTWDPANKDSSITLSNGNLTCTYSGYDCGAFATAGASSGKYYWEVSCTATGGPGIGIANSSSPTSQSNLGQNGNNWAVLLADGRKSHTGWTAYTSAWGAGDVMMITLDMDNGKIWWGKNGTWAASGDPAAGTNAAFSGITGTIYPFTLSEPPKVTTANFGASAFTYTPPTGFSGWGSDPANMVLVSEIAVAETAPDEAFIVVWQEDVDSVTLNTDLIAAVSRDDGTTWTNVTLVEEANLSTGRILAGSADISAQPSDTDILWRLTVANSKEMKVHGVGISWS